MASPLISVILPVRDAGPFLGAALGSLRAQSLADFEVIAIDDGSQDETPAILARHAQADPRLGLHRQDQQGLIAALNRGLALAKGRFIARMDADDIAGVDRFARQAAYLESHPEVAVVGSAYDLIDGKGQVIERHLPPCDPAEVRQTLQQRNCIAHPTVMARTAALRDAGGYRAAFVAAEDYDLWLRLSEVAQLANLPVMLLSYRRHAAGVSVDKVAQQILSEFAAREAAARRRRGELDPTALWGRVTRETVVTLGIDGHLLDRRIRNRMLRLAREARQRREREAASRLITLARGFLPSSADWRERTGFYWRVLRTRV